MCSYILKTSVILIFFVNVLLYCINVYTVPMHSVHLFVILYLFRVRSARKIHIEIRMTVYYFDIFLKKLT